MVKVAQRLEVDIQRIKLVCTGKVLRSERTLSEQNVSNGSIIMALVMAQTVDDIQKENNAIDRVRRIRADAELIINDNERSDFLSLEDQDGNALHLPQHEKKALLMALTLNEKGKAALRKNNFEEALLLFLEADSDFRMCNSQFLTVVDNYALLNLDIVWCYLCLKNLNQLPDAEQRIHLAEKKLRQSYGDNLNRVTAIKGNLQCNEKALLARLHLLKAVLYFHQNKRDDAKMMFKVVETELQSLKIDDQCLSTLLECGFELSESRIALRATCNCVEAAIEFINNRRQMVADNSSKSKREKQLYKNIGYNNPDGNRINMERLDQLVEMGYNESLAAIALKKAGNDLMNALNELQTNEADLKRELIDATIPPKKLIAKLADLGFKKDAAQAALKQTINNYEEAVELLINARRSEENDTPDSPVDEQSPSTSSSTRSMTTDETSGGESDECPNSLSPACKRSKSSQDTKAEMMEILYQSFSKDMDTNSDTYLDVPLIEEANILNEYKKMLNME
ncbi:NEDD8 ultimate buster 1-like isoform X2 [Toxorhynchites rutilus septentrionalis]|nr:NEDD8 ultimate buster 1-like isoform X2 [Toxorhynchites rutilus septentrionalis]